MTTSAAVFAWLTYGTFAAGSVALGVIDARTKRLPDRIVFPLYGSGLAGLTLASWLGRDRGALVTALASMAVLYGLFYLLAMFGPMGYGDVKLAGVLGLHLGWLGLSVVYAGVLLGTVGAALVALTLLALRRARIGETQIPYGPYLLAVAWAAIALHLAR